MARINQHELQFIKTFFSLFFFKLEIRELHGCLMYCWCWRRQRKNTCQSSVV